MALIGINPVSSERRERGPSTLEQIALGVDIAAKVLGTGLNAYKVLGIEKPETEARTKLYEAQAAATPGDKDLERQLKQSQIDYYGAVRPMEVATKGIEYGKAIELAKHGKPLSEKTVEELSAGQSVPKALQEVYETIDKNADIFGPISGRFDAANPWNTRAQTINSDIKSRAQIVGKYLEGGVLRKEDVPKYEAMLPSVSDTPDVARNKAAVVQKLVKDKFEATYKNLKASGYDVRAFEMNPLADLKLPDYLDSKIEKTMKQAESISGPKAGDIVDGYKFGGGNPADPKSWEKVK